MITCLVADDQELIRSGIVMVLRAHEGIDVIGEAGDGAAAVAAARRLVPDVVIMDIRMPDMDGITATQCLVEESASGDPDKLIKVLILTTFNDDELVYRALAAGASGFLLKYAAADQLVQAVHSLARGHSYLDPAITGRVIEAMARGTGTVYATKSDRLNRLTSREKEILALMAEGLSNTEIKQQLYLSEATVKTHVSRILIKTGSRDRTQAVVLAYKGGLIRP